MFVDSHCHLDRIDLAPYQNQFADFVADARQQQIEHMLCIGIDLEVFPAMRALVAPYDDISLSVGVHPNVTDGREPSVDDLLALAQDAKVIAIGETGLDYFHSQGDVEWQHRRFRTHIQVAKILQKPLIIHTRNAGHDSLDVLREAGADQVGGIIHCFTEDWAYAEKALDLGFYIAFSGIVTFKNAHTIKDVAQRVPSDRFLIETDSPYLAPMPHRGKPNYPTYVRYVAEHIAELRNTSVETIAQQSRDNFYRLFALN
ncbi:MAG: TatD family hydrolase [Methylomonas sp.]|nr:TatD family hydrolase [Methylomonas sp.]PPD20573.1 MAG: TatD family deoxyribonuclease [Methylomonas sp.]PPD25649.1 MAG: TatD family deoxyribonuclease [Methylomonas sp.]PPD36636.1 MAG: TatD family deoxyribonuclease [Methylomonas sp.]PPD42826.1 MAG: TatD family deoxyribonuclease [Methylomonas sp.]